MANGEYTDDWTLLDIDLSACEQKAYDVYRCESSFMINPIFAANNIAAFYCPTETVWGNDYCVVHSDFIYKVWLSNSETPDQIECVGNTDLGRKVCNSLNL